MKMPAFIRPSHRRPAMAAALCLLLALAHTSALAIKVTVTDKDKKLVATALTCKGFVDGKSYKDCSSTASISETSLDGKDAEFKKSFDAWNKGLAEDKKWTMADGGKLPGGEFKVSTFQATVGNTIGGVKIRIDWDYAGADKDKFQWAQGLLDNYVIGPPAKIVDPFYEMDNLGSTTSPLYPYQYADRHFSDGPTGPMPNGSFSARTFLSQIDAAKRVLTLYEGVSYGFVLSATAVPEPAGLALALAGVALLMGRRLLKQAPGLGITPRRPWAQA
jgi:hypothetical protein